MCPRIPTEPQELEHPEHSEHSQSPGDAAAGAADALRMRAEAILRALVGSAEARLHADQWQAIEALVRQRRRALVVQRTGWGKSAVYFVATALIRQGWSRWQVGDRLPEPLPEPAAVAESGRPGPTVIISPLLALMRDQVAAAQRAGINAVTMNSANAAQWEDIEGQIRAGEVDVLLISPERLNNPDFRVQILPSLAAGAGLVVIDEAHCISDWGHDFRPDYRRICTLLAHLPPGTPVLATTATANTRVSADVAEQLEGSAQLPAQLPAQQTQQTGAGEDSSVLVLRGCLDRPSLHLGVKSLPDSATRLAWLSAYLHAAPGSGIVYCLTISAATAISEYLRAQGLEVAAYTGKTEPAEREGLEEDLKANRVKALVATSALGMGFDKPDLAFVVHMGAPNSPVSYYQQVGRAGRGVSRAEVVLLPGAEDRRIWEYFGSQAFPTEPIVREVLAALEAHHQAGREAVSTPLLETSTSLRRSRLEVLLKVLDVDGAVQRVPGGWQSTGKPWSYDAPRYKRVALARRHEQEAMLAYASLGDNTAGATGADDATGAAGPDIACRMAFLRGILNDPQLAPDWRCGNCDLCGGLVLPQAPDAAQLSSARKALERPGVEVTPRRQWPVGMAHMGLPKFSGRIAEEQRADTGLAVGRLDGLGISTALRAILETQADGPVPVHLRQAVLDVADRLAALDAADNSDAADSEHGLDAVVVIDSRTCPQLVRHLGHALSQHLDCRPLGIINVQGPAGSHDVNSARRLSQVATSLSLTGWQQSQFEALKGARVVLVDDYTDSGWTLTVAAALLRRAGAAVVRPFVLAQR